MWPWPHTATLASVHHVGLCVCLQLCVFTFVCICIYVGNACFSLSWMVKIERDGYTLPSRTLTVRTTHSVRPVCSLWHQVKQKNNWDLKMIWKLTSLHAETMTFSPGWIEISRGTIGNGELRLWVLSRKSYSIFWSVSINQSINIKTIPWNLTALRKHRSEPSQPHCSVTLREILQTDNELSAGKQARIGKWMLFYSIDLYLLLNNVT